MKKKIIRFVIYIILFAWIVYQFGIPKYTNINAHEESVKLYKSIENDTLNWQVLGYTKNANKIYSLEIGSSENTTLLIGNIHGDEYGSLNLVLKFARFINNNQNLLKKGVVIIPTINPDGMESGTRKNINGVDLNRNFPSKNWTPVYSEDNYYPGSAPASEKETVFVLNLINKYKPEKVISIHSNQHLIEYAGPAFELATEMSKKNEYKVVQYNGYSTPGSLDTYTGIDLGIPTITLELRRFNPEKAWAENKDALISAINF